MCIWFLRADSTPYLANAKGINASRTRLCDRKVTQRSAFKNDNKTLVSGIAVRHFYDIHSGQRIEVQKSGWEIPGCPAMTHNSGLVFLQKPPLVFRSCLIKFPSTVRILA